MPTDFEMAAFENTPAKKPALEPWSAGVFVTGLLVFGAAGALVFFVFDPARVPLFPACMFHRLTGLDCPGCGAQRALHQLLHGNIVAALRLNAMFVLSLPLFGWMGTRFVLRKIRNEPGNFHFKWFGFYLAVWIVFGVLRNLPWP